MPAKTAIINGDLNAFTVNENRIKSRSILPIRIEKTCLSEEGCHGVTGRSAVPERSEVVWFLSAPIIIPSLHFSPNPNKYPVMERDPVFLTLLKISGFSPWAAPSV